MLLFYLPCVLLWSVPCLVYLFFDKIITHALTTDKHISKKSDKHIFPVALVALVAVFDGRCSVFTFAAGDKKLAILATSLPAELAPLGGKN